MTDHVQLLLGRIHFSAVAVDFNFNGKGFAQFPGDIERVLGLTGAIYVQYSADGSERITKLDAGGKVDSSWGTAGTVTLPFDHVETWAYDARKSALIVAGYTSTQHLTNDTLFVLRLAANGTPDSGFGTGGVYSYQPPLTQPESGEDSAFVSTQTLTPLAHSQLLIGLSLRRTHSDNSYDPDIPIFDSFSNTVTESRLLKLRGNGTRDIHFGRRGMTVLTSVESSSENYDGDVTSESNTPAIAAVVPGADGTARVILTTTRRSIDSGVTTSFHFDVASRQVMADGTVKGTAGDDWNIASQSNPFGNSASTFDAQLIQPRDESVLVIGHSERDAIAAKPVAVFLTRGEKPSIRSIRLPASFVSDSISSSGSGYLVAGHVPEAAGYRSYVIRLNQRFRPDVRWAENGVAEVGAGRVRPDADGRILWTRLDRLERLVLNYDEQPMGRRA
jgi:hypothetical protein